MTQNQDTDFKVYFSDDPDPEKAGQGLAFAPFVKSMFDENVNYWMMSPSEQLGMIYLLENINPDVSIEIGTKLGGSLQVLSKYSKKVYSLDIDPGVETRLEGRYANVEFIIGPSNETLPKLLRNLANEKAKLAFILVDGDHSASGVETDINHILEFTPTCPLYIVMHDSFNPVCRKGLMNSRWSNSDYVHLVELDFISGTVNPSPTFKDQLWGGLALAIMLPTQRKNRFGITFRAQQTFLKCNRSFVKRIFAKLID